jgi:thiol:disulfide interchange protein
MTNVAMEETMRKTICLLTLLLLTSGLSVASQAQSPEGQTTAPAQTATKRATLPAIYDVKANGTEQIEKALMQARKERKNVLLQFGANWCGWCHKLHGLFASDKAIAAELKKNYVVVLIDVDKNHNADVVKKYDNPVRFGLPVIVVLDAQGKPLTTQDTAKLEVGDHHDPGKVMDFLRQWTPKPKTEAASR